MYKLVFKEMGVPSFIRNHADLVWLTYGSDTAGVHKTSTPDTTVDGSISNKSSVQQVLVLVF